MIRASRARWALSFADLSLLMLGFFVLLQANQSSRDVTLAGLSHYFGAIKAPRHADLAADRLFAPGEAMLSEAGHIQLLTAARPLVGGTEMLRIQSLGLAPGQHRFDRWDLSAARLGAVARALVDAGVAPDRIRIAGLAETDDTATEGMKGQTIRLIAASQGGG
jgi:hypothetical protein